MQRRMLYLVACLPLISLTGAVHRPGAVWAVHYSLDRQLVEAQLASSDPYYRLQYSSYTKHQY